MDFKRHIFWIVLSVVLLAAIGVWFAFTPSTDEAQSQLRQLKDDLGKDLEKLKKDPMYIKSQAYEKAAGDYLKKEQEETQKLVDLLKSRSIKTKFTKIATTPPTNAIEFDAWLGEFRKALLELSKTNGLSLYADAEKTAMFKDSPTDPALREETKKIDYRLKHMAIVEEIISTLAETKVRVNDTLPRWETDGVEGKAARSIGALSLDLVRINTADKSAEMAKKGYLDALSKAGRQVNAPQHETESDVPYKFMTVEIEFTAHMGAVPSILKQLETSNRYYGVISKIDMMRGSMLFPSRENVLVKTPGAQPTINTYYLDGPEKVMVHLDVYEYDEARAARLAAPAPKAPAKK